MIKITARLHPYGQDHHLKPLAIIQIFTTEDGGHHGYTIAIEGMTTLRGQVPKYNSGHRNLLHVLGAVMEDVKDKHDLGLNYITTAMD